MSADTALNCLRAVEIAPRCYVFEHCVWLSDEHGSACWYYLTSAAALSDGRAMSDPRSTDFESWLTERCHQVEASWWSPARRYAVRNINTGEIVPDAVLRGSPLAYQGVTVDLETGKLIAANLKNVPREQIYTQGGAR